MIWIIALSTWQGGHTFYNVFPAGFGMIRWFVKSGFVVEKLKP
jgi:hypothetical protein